jgi:hypothetical protein
MRSLPEIAVLAGIVLSAQGCGSHTLVQIPPRIDLTRHEILGVVEFASTAEGSLPAYTTSSFIEEMRADQGMIRVVELGPEDALLSSVGKTQLDREAFQAIGEQHGLTTIVVGDLDVSGVRPAISIRRGLSGISAAADVDARLGVRMIEVASGASIWSRSAEATRRVGHVNVLGGGFDFDADDPEEAYGDLVQALVQVVTEDFKVHWERRKTRP